MTRPFDSAFRRSFKHARIHSVDASAVINDALSQAGLMGDGQAPRMPAFNLPNMAGWDSGLTPAGQPHATQPVPEGGTWELRRYAGSTGSRDYRLFVPAEGAPKGLLVMLHGCTQNPEDFARGTRMNHAAEKADLAVAWPQQAPAHNPQSCWNWFRPEDQRREGGEPALLAALTQEVAAELGLPQGRKAVAGLSAGGAMAAILAVTHSDVFVAAGVHSGLPAGAARDMGSAFAAMRGGAQVEQGDGAPLIVLHGAADTTVSAANAEALVPPGGVETRHEGGGRRWTRRIAPSGSELWRVEGAGHAWFGGDRAGSYADPAGPDASTEIIRFVCAQLR
ncbi:extracellular catalytic domain type 1 short-chain-length polyhydroxyalkanoate depolymerase [Roseovarius indicus]|uniref:extracellular catalytic domain type 1 short-chain-length polyhydroxyalkanoate depolymerase n=1 Tax=Roseovarius indicus TaxID=540747 RepID=UPI004059F2DA